MKAWFAVLSAALFVSCATSRWTPPPELTGTWKAGNTKVVVRTDKGFMRFDFTPGFADAEMTINVDRSVSGRIGNTKFKEGTVKKNGGNPETTGIAYNVRCWWIGRIFEGDPEDSKQVELWLSPIKDGKMKAELRLTQNGSQFPMGDFVFVKVTQ